jgi:hypothetical protein
MFVSLWEDERALLSFTTLGSHVNAVRWTIKTEGHVWSGIFRLTGTSSMSEPWIGTVKHWFPLTASMERTADSTGEAQMRRV